jgi:hypothetical protein
MKQAPYTMNKANMMRATETAKTRVRDIIDLATEIAADSREAERLKRQECKACFYGSRLGGAAITERDCMCCGETQTYGSSATDVLCLRCAKQHNLCQHCGGDIGMRIGRRDWPESPNAR